MSANGRLQYVGTTSRRTTFAASLTFSAVDNFADLFRIGVTGTPLAAFRSDERKWQVAVCRDDFTTDDLCRFINVQRRRQLRLLIQNRCHWNPADRFPI